MRPMIRLATALLLPIALFVGAPGQAASCSVNPQDLMLSVDPLSTAPADAMATIAIACDAATALVITLGPGNGSYAARKMTGGSQTLDYNLYVDPARRSIWGDGTNGTSSVSQVTAGGNFTVYARAPAGQHALKPGMFTDTISVTVTY